MTNNKNTYTIGRRLKSKFTAIEKMKKGWAVRWDCTEVTEGEGEEALVFITYKEMVLTDKPNYEMIASALIRVKYSLDAELAIQRQRESKPDDFAEYNDFCEVCKAEAREIVKED